MPKYTYQPLDKPASEFRLLQISKDPLTHQPQCTLQKYSLTDCPAYTALSYTWGEPTPTHSVAVDRSDLEVRQNLFDFLNAYITEAWGIDNTTRPVFYWIDQICINQEDLVERSDQVHIMSKIYKQAKIVLGWLGSDPIMIKAARWLHDRERDRVWAFHTLLAHPYFTRTWIVQEIALSVNSPLIVCGGIELDWFNLHFLPAISNPPFSVAMRAIALSRWRHKGRRTLKNTIQSHCESHCHDPRDKVYGLLGLTPERWRVRVDYTKEVLEVYFDAVAALYEELFDVKDLKRRYLTLSSERANSRSYRIALVDLARAMGVPQQQRLGLKAFLDYVQAAYLSTKKRNIQYTYTGPIYTRVQAQSSSELILAPEEIEVSWGSITATRLNPLMCDIIPEMGLQLASATTESIVEQSGDSVPAPDRWWCKYDGGIHYFDCFDESSDESPSSSDISSDGYADDSADGSSDDGLGDRLSEE